MAGLAGYDQLPPMETEPVSINVQDVPLPVLANEIFGSLLGLNVNMSPEVSALESLVTLNTRDSVAPRELFQIARQVLADYGVAVVVEGDLVRLSVAASGGSAVPPLIVSGRALPDVPISHRPVFQLVELDVVGSGDAARWLTTLFGQEVSVTAETGRNAILISGKPAQVRQAIDALRVFDRPLMRGRLSTRIEPAFLSADQLSTSLTEVLNLQGYSANRSVGAPASVIVLPVTAANTVLIFASSRETLDYAISWARELDRPGQQSAESSVFYYQVRNTKAVDLAQVLSGTLPSNRSNATNATEEGATPNSQQPAAARQPQGGRATTGRSGSGVIGASLLVDEPRNALIYQGDPAQWERMLRLIRQMDQAPRQVMIEVTIAEVTLTGDMEYGLSWFAKNGIGRFDGSGYLGSGSGGANPAPSGSGLTYLLDVAGQNRVALNAFANDNRVSILSTPRLLVKSGSEANIDVGTEVPTVTMTTTSAQQSDGNTNLLQSIQYRKTGIILSIKPTVYSDDRIDLDISQEVSEALPLESGATGNSPSIFNRSVNTSLTLRDGGSVAIAGLISDRSTNGEVGIPLIKDVPLLGNLFKSKTLNKSRTELVLILVPYIVETDERVKQLSSAVIDQFELLNLEAAIPTTPAVPVLPSTPSPGGVPVQPAPATTHPLPPPPSQH
ncbi:secretin N-terminal domain-containing protein [Luteimonas marina]|uniref:secretin N-terminal domain-containing protein n=1 Tax=Luteimonas marina TaxID=488485 RepID=UPI001315ADA5|nr:secretin N-terminal domain-containing protein [Luteimonas marina]